MFVHMLVLAAADETGLFWSGAPIGVHAQITRGLHEWVRHAARLLERSIRLDVATQIAHNLLRHCLVQRLTQQIGGVLRVFDLVKPAQTTRKGRRDGHEGSAARDRAAQRTGRRGAADGDDGR